MRGVPVNSNGTPTKGLVELKNHVQSKQKNARDGAKGGGQGNSDEEESRINNDVNSNPGPKDLIQRPQGSQSSAVSWQRFLPFGTLKVLLVEFDDSTRHVVSALLRNCSYEVTAVSNCIEAWKILEDLTSHTDLVLTEVAMPYISGISLLSKIMNHKTCKTIPVIMMSANDSMGIVFKCLSKGAVDFLVKPIRKNELKNLWQHVWRKCHSSCGSGSGSESGIRTQKSSKSKSVEKTGNNNVSNGEDDIASLSLNDKNGSDNGSGTQSSWTKRAVEVDSPKHTSPWEELADAPDSICAQVMDLSPEEVTNNWVLTTATRELVGNIESGDVAMGKDLGIGIPINSDLQIENESKEASLPLSATLKRRILESETENNGAILQEDKIQLKDCNSNDNSREEVADLIGVINSVSPQMDGVAAVLPSDISKNMKDECLYDPKEIPSVELSLKRPRDVAELEVSAREQNVLRRSNLSAFSRYNTIPTASQTPTGIVGSCSPPDNSSEAEKTGNLLSNSNGIPNQRSNGSSNNDMGSTTNITFAVPESSDKTVPKSAVNARPCSAFQPVRNGHPPLQPITPRKGEDVTVNTIPAQDNGKSSQVQVQHHHHHYHHYHHHVHNSQQKKAAKADDSSLRTMAGPPSSLPTPVEGNAANYSLNGSGSGSYNGSNGQNGSGTAVFTEGANINNENGLAENSGPGAEGGSGSGSGSGSGVDQSRHAHREAALNRFRLKRKERCFDKKVRYQSRKKLAEQRPRVRGQFVRQGVYENKSIDTDC